MNKYKSLFVLLLAIVIAIPTFGQIKKAKKQMDLFNYSQAVSILKKTISKNDPNTNKEATLLIAECYRKQNDMLNAKAWYGRALENGNTDPMNFYYYGQTLRATGEYQKAKTIFLHYDSISSGDKLGKIYASFCDSAMAWQSNPPAYEVKNASALNSKQSDFGPAFYDNGIIYASDRVLSKLDGKKYGWTGNDFLHLFYADPIYLDDYYNDFNAPKPAPGLLNQEYHDGPATFNKTYTEIFLNRTFVHKDKGKKDNKNIRTHLLKIFTAMRKDGKWEHLTPFFLNNEEYSVGHPSLSPDGNTLYFVSDMKGGYGGTDIYYCTREGGKWSNPTNLGDVINTFGNEMFPFIADSGNLYFASDGHAGFGGLDIFVSRMVDGKWTTPKNLGLPINSSYDDFSLAVYKNTGKGLFCSNRLNGQGADDIYCFNRIPVQKPKPPAENLPPASVVANLPPRSVSAFPQSDLVSGCVKDKTTLNPIPGATVFLLNDESRKVIIYKANSDGCFKIPVKKGTPYLIKAMQNNYSADCLPFSFALAQTRPDLSIPRDLLLDKLGLNRKFEIENIYYDLDKYYIRKDAEPALNKLVSVMKENPVSLELNSYCDCRASVEYNIVLSKHRAESAVRYIVLAGINRSRITSSWFGKSHLTNNCDCSEGNFCPEDQHQTNRRTEFKLSLPGMKLTGTPVDLSRYREGDTLDLQLLPPDFFKNCDHQMLSGSLTELRKPSTLLSQEQNSNVLYTVQVGAFSHSDPSFNNLSNVMKCKGSDGILRCFVGKYSSKAEAIWYRDHLRSSEFTDAFVTVMDDKHQPSNSDQGIYLSKK